MNIVVIGPGAIGSLWATSLQRAGHQVSLWSRQQARHLSLQLDDSPALSFQHNDLNSVRRADLILVTVKAWQVEQALAPVIKYIDPNCMLMLMHNGMGAVDSILSQVNHLPVLLATTSHGAYRPSPQQVLHTGQGRTQIGGYNELGKRCTFICDVFNHALPMCEWFDDIEQALWQKLTVNCAINPLTALENCKNGQLGEPRYQADISAVIKEAAAVMQAEGLNADLNSLTHTVQHVITATANNFSSMQQDVFYTRKTEIDFITGYLLKRAQHHGIAAPVNQRLYQAIKQQEPVVQTK